MTLDDLCRELNNWFDEDPKDGSRRRYFGDFVITDGTIGLSSLGIKDGQYFRIVGSDLNDGVYQYPAEGLTDEIFNGAVWLMAVPPSVISLLADISAWDEQYGGATSQASSPFQSESFGGYSYSKAGNNGSSTNENGDAGSWQWAFNNRLNSYRRQRNVR